MNRSSSRSNPLQQVSIHFSRVAAASLLMMWGVVNLIFNALSFRNMEQRPDWPELAVSGFLIFCTGLIPFLIGLVWLWKLMNRKPGS